MQTTHHTLAISALLFTCITAQVSANVVQETISTDGYLLPVVNNYSKIVERDSIMESVSSIFELRGADERSSTTIQVERLKNIDVHTAEELRQYVQSMILNNTDIKVINSGEDRVSITRDMPVKLLGIIALTAEETIEFISWGDGMKQVKISRPWWNMLSENQITPMILSADIEKRTKNIPLLLLKTNLDSNTKAYILSEIESSLLLHSYLADTVSN